MSTALRFRLAIAKQLSQLTQCSESKLLSLLRAPKRPQDGQFCIPLPALKAALATDHSIDAKALADKFTCNDMIAAVSAQGPFLNFKVQPVEFTKQTLQQVFVERERYGWSHVPDQQPQPTVVIDYSSPNIAKPFHAGHLRSTIIGNFVKRIHQVMGYRVIGINYLGDWGKQYGMLAVGYERYGDDRQLETDPTHHLYDVYVKINRDAKEDPGIEKLANAYFKRMEEGDPAVLDQWRRFRELSIASYASIYERLGISFEVYSGESQVNDYIPRVHERLRSQKLLTQTEDGAYAVDLQPYQLGTAIVQRADGTSLYRTRDLASLMMRKEQYKFDKAIYVVGVDQEEYFRQVFKMAELVFGSEMANKLQHVSFGHINGMSTRQGTAVFLQDILDTAKANIKDYMKTDKTIMNDNDNDNDNDNGIIVEEIADQLGVSAIIVQDMRSKRAKNYTFSWDRMTDSRGDTGVFLQYAHAKACGIERKAAVAIRSDCNFELLQEKEAFELVQLISQFPETVDLAFETLEPCTIVNYLFRLSHATSSASQILRVKDMESELAASRMLLFWAARMTLSNGLSLLGIKPIEHM